MATDENLVYFGTLGGEPLCWQVVERTPGEALLVSRAVIGCVPFNAAGTPTTWEACSLRRWLNGRFLHAAFTPEEQRRLLRTTLPNPGNVTLGVPGCPDTADWVFCLSAEEARRFLPRREDLLAPPTPYALRRRLQLDVRGEAGWWTRTPGASAAEASDVCGGRIMTYGLSVGTKGIGVRPALRVQEG